MPNWPYWRISCDDHVDWSPRSIQLPEKNVIPLLQWFAAQRLTTLDLWNAARPGSGILEARRNRGSKYAITVGERPFEFTALQIRKRDMPKGPKGEKRPADVVGNAVLIGKIATGEAQEATDDRNPHAVALGKLGGKKGGKARAKKLSAKSRKAIASNAANKRWGNRP